MQQEIWFQKYKILGLLGRGGTAKVYLAEHIKLNSYRVIKVISKHHPFYLNLRNEAFVLKNLKHSCIPIIYDIEENEEGSYIVEQYLEGETLAEHVAKTGGLQESIILNYGIQLCDLIHYLHCIDRPIFYLDLKPDNIIIHNGVLKLVDFGSAIFRDELVQGQAYFATRGYAAPELYHKGRIDERCDIYGVGMLLYYMATGIPIKKQDEDILHIDQAGNCSKQLKVIINRCLKYQPSHRPASIEILRKKLSAITQKNQFVTKDNTTLYIAVAGGQSRIGTTHFAFRLCNYLHRQGLLCLYYEENDSKCIALLKNRCNIRANNEGRIFYQGITMEASHPNRIQKFERFQVVVKDLGVLTEANLNLFQISDLKILVLGAKYWELEQAEKVLSMVSEDKNILYLFNFLDGLRFQTIVKNMRRESCYRIPHEPDLFRKTISKCEQELFSEILNHVN
ncbi:MAG: serine/threonine-protein kinase [Mobilitalea sp.]